jgi:hypothetical protein
MQGQQGNPDWRADCCPSTPRRACFARDEGLGRSFALQLSNWDARLFTTAFVRANGKLASGPSWQRQQPSRERGFARERGLIHQHQLFANA